MDMTHGGAAALKRAKTLACFIVQDAKLPAVGGLWNSGKAFAGAVARAQAEGFGGKEGQIWVGPAGAGLPERLILVGCGPRERNTFERVRRAAGQLARRLREWRGGPVDVIAPAASAGEEDAVRALRAAAEGLRLGAYRFLRHKSKPAAAVALSVRMHSAGAVSPARAAATVERAGVVADATNFARDLVNEPAGHLTPTALARAAKSAANGRTLKTRVYGKTEIRRMKMGGLLGVNQGSVNPPAFIHMTYKPRKGKPRRRIALVGKGITFDSGGLCIKPADGMVTMKDDMGGAACVLAVLRALPALDLPIEVHGIVPSTENMTGGDAFKPGDVLRAMNGKTIEVTNTDAEGRLVLADALTYACRLGVDEVIDYATLTGAVVIALGNSIAGIWGKNQDQILRLLQAASAAGENLWQMPLYDGYRDNLRSQVADMVNSERRDGSAIKAALFLSEFVDHDVWSHIDIAGTAWTDKELPYGPVGGTGAGVRLTLQYLSSL